MGNRGIRPFISGEQGNKSLKLKGTKEQRQFWGTGNRENQDFDFWEQGKMPMFFSRETREKVPPPSTSPGGHHHSVACFEDFRGTTVRQALFGLKTKELWAVGYL